MEKVSIIVPVYNGEAHIEQTLGSIMAQAYPNLEIIVSDDASHDGSCELVKRMQALDSRIILIGDNTNRGTLCARKRGAIASSGDYILFVDQDDELAPAAVSQLMAFAKEHPADIYHFSAQVIPENEGAREACFGMQSFLTPTERTLTGTEVLVTQLKLEGGFDWHLHHKMFRGEFARGSYTCTPDTRLVEADDFYLCFIMAAFAHTYRAIPNAPLYRYHLGRGETFGATRTVESVLGISSNNREAYRLIEAFAKAPNAPSRDDWDARLSDARCCLLDYPMNEWKDALDQEGKVKALPQLLCDWPAEYVCAELWRFSRDTAYALWTARNAASRRIAPHEIRKLEEEACFHYGVALEIEREFGTEKSSYARYRDHKRMALAHARDAGLPITTLGLD